MSDEIIVRLVQEAIFDKISEKEKQNIIKEHIKDKLHYRDISDVVSDNIKIIVRKEVIRYINEHPEVFNDIPKMVEDAFNEEMKDIKGIRSIIKQFVKKATLGYYLERQMDRLV